LEGGSEQILEKDPVEDLVDYNILLANYSKAAEILDSTGQTKEAMLVKVVELGNGFPYKTVMDRHEANKADYNQEKPKTVHDLGPFDKDLAVFTNL
jgi:hypothetical protein